VRRRQYLLYFKNVTLLTPDRRIERGALLTEGGRIKALGALSEIACPAEAEIIDAAGCALTPGFIDLQINGGFGYDFTAAPETIWAVAAELPCYGVTSFLPTVITSPLQTVDQARAVVARPPAGFLGATPFGLHVEGPFLNPQKRGAHNPTHLRVPDPAAVAGWSPETGVRLVTLAPELPGALAVVEALVARGVVVSAGHSAATYAEAQAGFAAGIRYGTHLFNAMSRLDHREPGLVGALLSAPEVAVGLIADGVHVHPALVGLVWRALGGHRLTLVTDAMAALGMPPGRYVLGEFEVAVDETSVRLADGTLAGSILSLDTALRNLVRFAGCSLGDALLPVTSTPAALLGLAERKGRLAPGYDADLTMLTPQLAVALTVVGGRVAYRATLQDPE